MDGLGRNVNYRIEDKGRDKGKVFVMEENGEAMVSVWGMGGGRSVVRVVTRGKRGSSVV